VEYLNMGLLQIYHWVCQWKNCEIRLTFGEVIGKSLVSCFFWLTVYMLLCTCVMFCSCIHGWCKLAVWVILDHFKSQFVAEYCRLSVLVMPRSTHLITLFLENIKVWSSFQIELLEHGTNVVERVFEQLCGTVFHLNWKIIMLSWKLSSILDGHIC